MVNSATFSNTKIFYLISSIVMVWMGLALTFCYEMGKHGLGIINWSFVFQSNLSVLIIAGLFFILAFRKRS